MLGCMTHKLESRLPGSYQQPQICRWYHSNGRKQRETKEPLDESERGEWKTWLKTQHWKNEDHGIQSYHFMPIDGEKSKQWQILSSWVLQSLWTVTVAMKLERRSLLGRKAMKNLDSILKSRDITLPTKVCTDKAVVFTLVMYGSKSWTLKKAECWRTDAFKLSDEEDSWQSLGLQGD